MPLMNTFNGLLYYFQHQCYLLKIVRQILLPIIGGKKVHLSLMNHIKLTFLFGWWYCKAFALKSSLTNTPFYHIYTIILRQDFSNIFVKYIHCKEVPPDSPTRPHSPHTAPTCHRNTNSNLQPIAERRQAASSLSQCGFFFYIMRHPHFVFHRHKSLEGKEHRDSAAGGKRSILCPNLIIFRLDVYCIMKKGHTPNV